MAANPHPINNRAAVPSLVLAALALLGVAMVRWHGVPAEPLVTSGLAREADYGSARQAPLISVSFDEHGVPLAQTADTSLTGINPLRSELAPTLIEQTERR